MKKLKNFKQYIPETPTFGTSVAYLHDEAGNDWYEQQKEFASETVKFAYDEDGIICAVTRDVSLLWPINLSVAELNEEDAPDGLSDNGQWFFDGFNIMARVYTQDEIKSQAKQKKSQLLSEVYATMKPLELAVKNNMANNEEKAQLSAWERYCVLLNRVNTDDAPDITWPAIPVSA